MTVEVKYNFDTSSDYTFDPAFVEVSGGSAKLKLANKVDQSFEQDFTSDAGFIYDSNLIEFDSGLVRQKNQSENYIAAYSWDTVLLADWATVNSTVTPFNGAAISGGYLECDNSKYVEVDKATIPINTGTIRMIWSPNYNGVPANRQDIFLSTNISGTLNRIRIQHATSGQLNINMTSDTGAQIINFNKAMSGAVAGQDYEIEVNWDLDGVNGNIWVFFDGVLESTQAGLTGTRDTDIENSRVGNLNANADFKCKSFSYRTSVTHTSSYVAPLGVAPMPYGETNVILPIFNYSGIGAIQAFQSIAEVITGVARWILNGKYWDGGQWSMSDGSFAQSSDESTINANLGSLQVSNSLIVSAVFTDSLTTTSIDNFEMLYTGQEYVSDSTVLPNTAVPASSVIDFIEEATYPANTEIKYAIEINAIKYWYNGADWLVSNGVSESNTALVIAANIDSLPISETGDFVRPLIYLITTDGADTPLLNTICIAFVYDVNPVAAPDKTIIFGSLRDIVAEPMTSGSLRVEGDSHFFIEGNSIQPSKTVGQANVEGVAAVEVIKTAAIDYKYSFYIDYLDSNGKSQTVSLGRSVAPDDTASNIANLTFEA